MSNIVHNLKKFFNEQQDEAAIPGLGVFFKQDDSTILFVEKTPRSNAFVNFFGYEENLTENEAIEIIELWVSDILNDLRSDKVAYIPELGTFEIKKDKVVFTPASDQNPTQEHSSDKYGLGDEIQFEKPKKPSKKMTSKKEKQPMNRAVLWSIIGAIAVILIVLFIISGAARSFTEGFREGWSEQRAPQPIVIGPVAEVSDEICDEGFVEMPQVAQLRFSVIGGAFAVRTNAEDFLAQKRGEGYNAELIFDRNRQLHLVTLGSFTTRDEAVQFRNRVRTTTNITDAWIFAR